jgi:hypothetical protein
MGKSRTFLEESPTCSAKVKTRREAIRIYDVNFLMRSERFPPRKGDFEDIQ